MYLVIGLLLVVTLLLWYLTQPFFWKKKNVPYLIPLPLFGNILPLLKYDAVNFFIQLNKKFPGQKYFGMHFVTKPALYIKDTQIIQNILVKDFEYFLSRGFYSNQERDLGGANLLLLKGQQWKEMRGKLSQYFTPSKVKAMLGCVDSTIDKLKTVLDKNVAAGEPCEMAGLMKLTTNDILTQSLFGVETDILTNENSTSNKIAKELVNKTVVIKLFIGLFSPKLYNLLKLTLLEKEFYRLVTDIVVKAMDHRRKNNIYRQDFLQGMMELLDKEQTDERKYFPDNTRVPVYNLETIISQAIILHGAGFETTAAAMTSFLYEMALNPEIQTKCRSEVNSIVDNEPLSVDHLSKLPYLTAAIQETMRIYPPVLLDTRECTKRYKFPDSDLVIEPGTFVIMSPICSQMNEEYFPEPKIFRPERFLDEEKNKINPGTYFPFGLGPRICIGMQFAYGDMKLVLGRLLQLYEFRVCSKTHIPLQCCKYHLTFKPAQDVWLQLIPLKVTN